MRKLLTLLLTTTLGSGSLTVGVVTGCSCSGTNNAPSTTNLNNVTITYFTIVKHMKNIDSQEANNIKTGVKNAITEKMQNLNCQEGVDYFIIGLNTLIADADLNAVTITVLASSTTSKLTSSTDVVINVKEDIDDRTINPAIEVQTSEASGLTNITAIILKNTILEEVTNIVTASQENIYGTDYIIDHIDDIQEGAVYNDYKDLLYVKALNTSFTLTGEFKIDFQLV